MKEDLLRDFVDWLESCGEDTFYIFDNRDEAIKKFLNHKPFVHYQYGQL